MKASKASRGSLPTFRLTKFTNRVGLSEKNQKSSCHTLATERGHQKPSIYKELFKIKPHETLKKFLKDFNEDDSVDLMNESEESIPEKNLEVASLYGVDGLKNYQKLYKNHHKSVRKSDRNEYTTTTNYFKTIGKLKLSPISTGIVRRRGENFQINATDFKLGDNYAFAIGKTISNFPQLKHIYMTSNRLTNRGASGILSNFHKNITVLNLASNQLDHISYQIISKILIDHNYQFFYSDWKS